MSETSRTLPRFLKQLAFAAALSVATSLSLTGAVSAASFQGLGALPGGDSTYSKAWDISPDGSVVVGESRSANGIEAFRWTAATGMVGLGDLGGAEFHSTAFGVSTNGLVVVGGSRSPLSGERLEAFRWTAATGMVGLGDPPSDMYLGAASGVSDDGSFLAGGRTSDGSATFGEAFRWSEADGFVGLGVLPGSEYPLSEAWGVSADGTVLVGWVWLSNRLAFRWTESEGMVDLGELPGFDLESHATAASADGSVIVGVASGLTMTPFRWTAVTGMVNLGKPPGTDRSFAWGVSADGSVVVGEATTCCDRLPTIWNESQGTRNLQDVLVEIGLGPQMAGWDLERATAISADGFTVVGWGYNPAGNEEAWVANLRQPSLVEIPTASNAALVLFGALLAAAAVVALRLR